MNLANYLAQATAVELLAVDSRSADANGAGVDMSSYEGAALALAYCKNVSGTTPTLDIKLQHCDTSGGTYTDITGAVFTQVTTAAGHQAIVVRADEAKPFWRAVYDGGGTSPVYLAGVTVIAQKKYR